MVRVHRPYLAGLLTLGCLSLTQAAEPDIQASLRKLAQAFSKEGKNGASVKKITAALAKNDDIEAYELMVPFRARSIKGQPNPNDPGFGIGAKPGTFDPDGIEALIRELASKEPAPAQVAALGKELEEAGKICLAICGTLPTKCPADKRKKLKLWKDYVGQFEASATAFVKAAQGKQPAAIKTATYNLDNICIKCHNDFK